MPPTGAPPGPDVGSAFADRTAGNLLVLGAALAALLVAIFGVDDLQRLAAARDAIYACSAAAAALGAVFLLPPRPKPVWLRYLTPSVAAVLICVPMAVGGTSTPAGQLLLVWPVLFAAYVLPERVAWWTLGVTLAAFGAVAASAHTRSSMGLWVEVAASLTLTTSVVATLRRHADALAGALYDQARNDPLTGLANRRSFDEFLDRQITGRARTGTALSLLTLDIDHFKKINDASGHPAGDVVLSSLAKVLTSQVRSGDLVARVGGEEFAVLLPSCTTDQARRRAEALRVAVADTSRDWDDPITVSVGVATIPDHAGSASALAAAADAALYQAKNSGRNAVCTADR